MYVYVPTIIQTFKYLHSHTKTKKEKKFNLHRSTYDRSSNIFKNPNQTFFLHIKTDNYQQEASIHNETFPKFPGDLCPSFEFLHIIYIDNKNNTSDNKNNKNNKSNISNINKSSNKPFGERDISLT